jgi:hypothetical protein
VSPGWFEYSGLRAADDISEFQQKCRFALRKPPFYPLNYGDDDICDFRFSIADCKWWTRALTPMFVTKMKSLRLLFSRLPDLI